MNLNTHLQMETLHQRLETLGLPLDGLFVRSGR